MSQDPQPSNSGPQPLNYATPGPGPAGGVPFLAQMALGVVAFVIGAVVSVVAAQIAGAVGGSIALPLMAAGLVQAAVIVAAVVVWKRYAWRGFFVGVVTGLLISVGLFLLAAGFCYVALSGMGGMH